MARDGLDLKWNINVGQLDTCLFLFSNLTALHIQLSSILLVCNTGIMSFLILIILWSVTIFADAFSLSHLDLQRENHRSAVAHAIIDICYLEHELKINFVGGIRAKLSVTLVLSTFPFAITSPVADMIFCLFGKMVVRTQLLTELKKIYEITLHNIRTRLWTTDIIFYKKIQESTGALLQIYWLV